MNEESKQYQNIYKELLLKTNAYTREDIPITKQIEQVVKLNYSYFFIILIFILFLLMLIPPYGSVLKPPTAVKTPIDLSNDSVPSPSKKDNYYKMYVILFLFILILTVGVGYFKVFVKFEQKKPIVYFM